MAEVIETYEIDIKIENSKKNIEDLSLEIKNSKRTLEDHRLELSRVNNEYRKGNLTKEETKKKIAGIRDLIIDETKKLQDLNRELENEKNALKDLNEAKKDEVKTTDELTKSIDNGNKSFDNAVLSVKNLKGAFKGLIGVNIAGMFTKLTSNIIQSTGVLDKLESAWKKSAVYQTLFKTDEKEREKAAETNLKNSQDELKNAKDMADAYEFSLLPAEEQRTKLIGQQAENKKKLANVEQLLENTELTQTQRNELLASKNHYLAEEQKYKTNIKQLDNEIAANAEKQAKKSGGTGQVPKEKDLTSLQAKIDAAQKSMDRQFLDSYEKRKAAAKDEYDNREKLIEEAYKEGLIDEQRKKEMIEQAEQNRKEIVKRVDEEIQENKKKLEDEEFERKRKLSEKEAEEEKNAKKALLNASYDATFTTLKSISDITGKENKKAFEFSKGLEIADATVSTIKGAVGAFAQASAAYPPPYGQIIGGITAGAVTASGLANIAKIKAAKFDSGSSASASTPKTVNINSSLPESTTSKITGMQGDLALSTVTPNQSSGQQPATQTVLVVDDVTAKQASQDRITKITSVS